MPHRRNKRRRNLDDRLTSERTRMQLDSGHDFPCLDPPPATEPLTETELREAWRLLGPELTATHISKAPGSRRAGWWRFESPGRRRRVRPGPKPIPRPGEREITYSDGVPDCYEAMPPPGMFESQRVFLKRHGLLTHAETLAARAMA